MLFGQEDQHSGFHLDTRLFLTGWGNDVEATKLMELEFLFLLGQLEKAVECLFRARVSATDDAADQKLIYEVTGLLGCNTYSIHFDGAEAHCLLMLFMKFNLARNPPNHNIECVMSRGDTISIGSL